MLHHRYVKQQEIQKKYGRDLRPTEVVHHKNGNRADNTPTNLEICEVGSNTHPPKQRVADLIHHHLDHLEHYRNLYPGAVEAVEAGEEISI